MRYFIDTEFDDARSWPELISLAIVAEDGREYYAELSDFDRATANPWVAEHVVPRLGPVEHAQPATEVRDEVAAFFLPGATEVWGMTPAYDWVLVHRLFGTWGEVPRHVPWDCWDLNQWRWSLGNPSLPHLDPEHAHHALIDARWAMQVHARLAEVERGRA
jgi:hypothetical protein